MQHNLNRPSAQRRNVAVTVASQRRRQIIDAARECIAEDGVEKLTLRGVAERAQVSHATIAYYFHSRRELVDSALLEMSADFLADLQRQRRTNGAYDLVELLTTFLDPNNANARYVVQMIDAGLHDAELRRTHDDFIRYGRESIEQAIEIGIARGEMRDDLDPHVAAEMFHGILVWWQSELAAGAVTTDQARNAAMLALSLLRRPGDRWAEGSSPARSEECSTVEVIERALVGDNRLSPQSAQTLATAFRSLYELAAEPHLAQQAE